MRKNFLVFGQPKIEQPEIDEVIDSLKSGWLGTGPKVHKFEEMFKNYKGIKYAMALNSCTAALHLSLLAIFDLVSDLCSKLKIVTTIVDTPGSICFHEDTILSVRDEIVQVPIAGFQAHIGHPYQRDSIPARCPHAAV